MARWIEVVRPFGLVERDMTNISGNSKRLYTLLPALKTFVEHSVRLTMRDWSMFVKMFAKRNRRAELCSLVENIHRLPSFVIRVSH